MSLYLQPHAQLAAPVIYHLWVINHLDSDQSVCETGEFPVQKCGRGWGQMLSLSEINSRDSTFLKDSCVWVGVSLTPPAAAGQGAHVNMPSISCFAPMYNDVEFSDTVVKAKDTTFQVHAVVLAAHSASFKAMLQANMQEKRTGKIDLPDTDPEVLTACLLYMYGRLRNVPEHLLLQVFMFADKHQIVQLRAACVGYMLQDISMSNFFDYVIAADSCCDTKLMNGCLAYSLDHSYALLKTPQMKQLMHDRPELAHDLTIAMFAPKSAESDEQ